MDITYFNWDEIRLISRGDLSAIICLAYAQTTRYNELSVKTLLTRLQLHHFAPTLSYNKVFIKHKHLLECTYKTKDPQSYFTDPSFLWSGASAACKVEYLKVLSLRKISTRQNWIPSTYYDVKRYNPFFTVEQDKIIFTYEHSW